MNTSPVKMYVCKKCKLTIEDKKNDKLTTSQLEYHIQGHNSKFQITDYNKSGEHYQILGGVSSNNNNS